MGSCNLDEMTPYDSVAPGFTPWWTRATFEELAAGIARLKRALRFCRGRAADLHPLLTEHIRFLEGYARRY